MKDNKSKNKKTQMKVKETKKTHKKNKIEKPKETEKTKKIKKRNRRKKILKIILIILLLLIIAGIACATAFMMMIVKEAPDFDPKNLYTQESSIIYGSNGEEIAKLGTEKREKISYDQMPQILIDAIVATEDSTFFQHNGLNAARFLMATFTQFTGGGGGGASTLTMQVSKNAYTSKVSSGFEGIKRKFTDIYLSVFKIEKTYTKEQIMEFYVNSYYLGGGAYGVEQACQNYFGKSVSEINLAEAAMIAGIYQAPGKYDPTINPKNTEERRKTVLYLMQRHGYITEEEKEIALQLTVDKLLNTKHTDGSDQINPKYKDFIDTVIEDVKQKTGYNPYTIPMLIYTTMDATKQEYLTNIMNGNNFNWENDKVQAGIAVVDTNNGAVVAIGAGRHRENEVGWNYATMNRKHIGSTAKPLYDYGPLIEYENASTYHLFYDEPYTYTGGKQIGNWDGGYKGFLTMREALKISRNIPALKAFQINKNENIKNFVTSLGLSPESEDGYIHEAHAIGAYGDGKNSGENPLSVAAAYAAFANGGYYTKPYTFTKIIYRNSDEEYVYKPVTTKVMSSDTAYMITDMLITTSGYVTKATSVNGVTYGSKTGTSNYPEEVMKKYHLPSNAVNDLWVAGICRDYATAVWYGYDELSSEFYNHGSGNTALYKEVIKGIYTGTPNFTRPSGVVSVTVEINSPGNGLLPSEYTPDDLKKTELFKAGTEPTQVSKRFTKLNNVSNLKAQLVGNKIQLNWTAIDTPNALNHGYFVDLYKNTCRNASTCASNIVNDNAGRLGKVTYQIYIKNADGSLKHLHGTEGTSAEEKVPTDLGNTVTYVIKTRYSNTDAMISDGVEVKIDVSSAIKKELIATLLGNNKVEIEEGTQYNDAGVKVIEKIGDSITNDVTSKATIDKQITKNNVPSEIKEPGTYKIIYNIEYNNMKKTLTRTVVVKKKAVQPTPTPTNPTTPTNPSNSTTPTNQNNSDNTEKPGN